MVGFCSLERGKILQASFFKIRTMPHGVVRTSVHLLYPVLAFSAGLTILKLSLLWYIYTFTVIVDGSMIIFVNKLVFFVVLWTSLLNTSLNCFIFLMYIIRSPWIQCSNMMLWWCLFSCCAFRPWLSRQYWTQVIVLEEKSRRGERPDDRFVILPHHRLSSQHWEDVG